MLLATESCSLAATAFYLDSEQWNGLVEFRVVELEIKGVYACVINCEPAPSSEGVAVLSQLERDRRMAATPTEWPLARSNATQNRYCNYPPPPPRSQLIMFTANSVNFAQK